MNVELYAEEIETAVAHVARENRNTARSVIKRLLRNASPGNLAWQILQNDWGFNSDYLSADAGEPPQGAHW